MIIFHVNIESYVRLESVVQASDPYNVCMTFQYAVGGHYWLCTNGITGIILHQLLQLYKNK